MQKLDDGASFFFIHIDKKAKLPDFGSVLNAENVQMVESVKINWAGFSIVQATLNGMMAIKESGLNFDRIILLSGQDYPVKSNASINNFLESAPHRVFMEYFLLPNHKKWQPGGGMYRVTKYYLGLKLHQRYAAKALNLLSRFLPFLKRSLPQPLRPFAGSAWWIIDMYALNYILGYVHNNPRYAAFHKHTFAPDEVFFQTILLNADDKRITESICVNNMRLIKWKDIRAAHPQVLTMADLNDIVLTEALFARKFDPHESAELLDVIDRHCLSDNYSSN